MIILHGKNYEPSRTRNTKRRTRHTDTTPALLLDGSTGFTLGSRCLTKPRERWCLEWREKRTKHDVPRSLHDEREVEDVGRAGAAPVWMLEAAVRSGVCRVQISRTILAKVREPLLMT